jgi:hypothetical protein
MASWPPPTGGCMRTVTAAARMLAWTRPPDLAPRFAATGHGIFSFVTQTGLEVIGHSGVRGAKMPATPANGSSFAGTVNRRGAKADWMIEIPEEIARR